MSVAHAQVWVIQKLAECNKLLFKTSIKHSYPHCWRCHDGLFSVQQNNGFVIYQKIILKKKRLKQSIRLPCFQQHHIIVLKQQLKGA